MLRLDVIVSVKKYQLLDYNYLLNINQIHSLLIYYYYFIINQYYHTTIIITILFIHLYLIQIEIKFHL